MYKCININCVQKKAFSSIKITIYKLTKTSMIVGHGPISPIPSFSRDCGSEGRPKAKYSPGKNKKTKQPTRSPRAHVFIQKDFFNTKGRPSFLPVQRWEFIKENKKVRKKEKEQEFFFSFFFSFFLDRFLARVLFFLFFCFLTFLFFL